MRTLSLLTLCMAVSVFSACSHNKTKTDESYPAVSTEDTSKNSALSNDLGSSDAGNALGLVTIHFPYDSNVLDGQAKSSLKKNAEILKANPAIRVQVEGHCDQRGGTQYNIALGERRANAVKHYLENLGINGDRVTTISFGKEHPVDTAETEEAYAKNRRANFVITKGLAHQG